MTERSTRDTWCKATKRIHARFIAEQALEQCRAVRPAMGLRRETLMERRRKMVGKA